MAEQEVQQTGMVVAERLDQRVVMPAANAVEAKKAWKEYEELKAAILDPAHDIQKIGKESFKKKSYWKKVQTFFNLDTEIREERKEHGPSDDPMDFVYHMTVRVTAPNGRFVDAVGSCASYEKADWLEGAWMVAEKKWNGQYSAATGKYTAAQPNTEHNVRSTAYTRASNRAISDLVGGGEVSAEEVSRRSHGDEDEEDEAPAAPVRRAAPKPAAKAEPKAATGEVVRSGDHDVDTATGEIVGDEADLFAQAAMGDIPTDAEIADMYDLAESRGYSREALKAMIDTRLHVADPSQMTKVQYQTVMKGLSSAAVK